jgi:hypothetical protein
VASVARFNCRTKRLHDVQTDDLFLASVVECASMFSLLPTALTRGRGLISGSRLNDCGKAVAKSQRI